MAFTSYQVFTFWAFLSESSFDSTLLSAVIRVSNYRHMQTTWFIPALLSVAPLANAQYTDVSPSALGSSTEVFEVRNGEARTNLPQIKRVEFGKTSVLATVRNDGTAPISPAFMVEVFNRYGMALATLGFNYQADPVEPGEVRVKEAPYAVPPIAPIFSESTIKLPPDWAEVRLVRIKPQGARESQRPGSTAIDSTHPRARPTIVRTQNVRPAILGVNPGGTSNIGLTAIDARWSNYGAYLQKMVETIQTEWERILLESRVYPPSGTSVSVKFVIDPEGRIAKIVDVDRRHCTEQGANACISGITNRAPFGPWTDDMKAVLGKQQEMTFTFYYQ